MDEIKKLLESVSIIIKHDKKMQAEKRARGECFNIFSTLGLYSQETSLHSKIVAALLDVKGDHGLGDAFLRSFIESVYINDLEFDTSQAKVTIEHYIGRVNIESGGRIDILIVSKNKAIIIENKIFAGDQPKQLVRYDKFAKDHYKDGYRTLYLTLDGHEASQESTGKQLEEGKDYFVISYREHIKRWLERCVEIAARQPLVRETIVQYIEVVNRLTNQTMNNENREELIKLITNNQDNLMGCSTLASLHNDALDHLFRTTFLNTLKEQVAAEGIDGDWDLGFHKVKKSYGQYSGFYFTPRTWNKYKIGFSFQGFNHRSLIKGVVTKEHTNVDKTDKDVEEIRKNRHSTDTWLFLYNHKYKDWSTTQFAQMYDKNSALYNSIIDDINEIMQITSKHRM